MNSKTTLKKLKIIVIDDEQSIRDTIKWHLQDLGHEVLTFEKPAECYLYQGHHCSHSQVCADALITDFHMPGMNGLQFIEKLFNHGCKGLMLNMMIMSGDTSNIDMALANQLGCRVVQKPLSLADLESWIDSVVLRSSANRPTKE